MVICGDPYCTTHCRGNTTPFDTTWLGATNEVHTAEGHGPQQGRSLADQGLKLIPHADGAARTAVVGTRGCMYTPAVLLPLGAMSHEC